MTRLLVAMALALLAALPAPIACAAASPAFDLQAHRGGRGETTEESLRAFAKAVELGVSTLELDVVISRDGRPMVWHDPVVEAQKCSDTQPVRAGDPWYPYVGKLVHDLTLAQLRTLDCGKLLPAFPDAEVVRGNRIATLDEVFALADAHRAAVRFDVETKVEAARPGDSAPPEEFVDVVLAAIRAAGKVDAVDVESFDWRTLPMVRAAEPRIPLVALWDDTTFVPGSPWLAGIDPAVVGDPVTAAAMVGADVLSPLYTLVDRDFVDRAHARGFGVIPWTVDDAASMNAVIDTGADGIITDYPSVLRRVMADRGLPLPEPARR